MSLAHKEIQYARRNSERLVKVKLGVLIILRMLSALTYRATVDHAVIWITDLPETLILLPERNAKMKLQRTVRVSVGPGSLILLAAQQTALKFSVLRPQLPPRLLELRPLLQHRFKARRLLRRRSQTLTVDVAFVDLLRMEVWTHMQARVK